MASQIKPDLTTYWPRGEQSPPSPWGLPLNMTAIGKIVAVETVAREDQVFKHQNFSAQIQIPIQPPDWLADIFPGLLDELHADALSLDLFRFHLGNQLEPEEWEDQWFMVICQPHFSYMPCVLSGVDEPAYKRLAWVKDNALCPIAERPFTGLPGFFPMISPSVTFNGFVDTHVFALVDNPTIGLDDVARNASAIFKTWSRITPTDLATNPKTGWYANYVYAMLPKCKPHLKKKCEDYRVETTPFRKHGKKAYITGYMHGFCNKKLLLSAETPYNPLVFIPFIEITDIDWAAGEPRQSNVSRSPFSTPRKREAVAPKSGKFVFDPFAQISADVGNASFGSEPASQSSDSTIQAADPFSVNDLQDVAPIGGKRLGASDDLDEGSDGPSPTKRSKQGSLRGRPKNKTG